MSFEERIHAVHQRAHDAATRAKRNPEDITVIAVSKTFPAHVIKEVLDAGVVHLGENRAQELKEKASVLGSRPLWHYIGPLQTNKVRQVIGTATLVHSVDRLGLADAISRRAEALGITQDVLIQVNISGEDSKHGIEPQTTVPLARQIAELPGLNLRGLMTIPPLPDEPEDSRSFYADLAELGSNLRREFPGADQLSMGMTRDFEIAIEQGATLVRVGEAIFGPRGR